MLFNKDYRGPRLVHDERLFAQAAAALGCSLLALREKANTQGLLDMGADPRWLPGYVDPGDGAALEQMEKQLGVVLRDLPPASPDVAQLLREKKIKVAVVLGEDPVGAPGFPKDLRDGLLAADFLIVGDLFLTATAASANVVLPLSSTAETSGTMTNAERRVQRLERAVPPAGGMETWEILSRLAGLLGYRFKMKYGSAQDVTAEIRQVVPIWAELDLGSAGAIWDADGLKRDQRSVHRAGGAARPGAHPRAGHPGGSLRDLVRRGLREGSAGAARRPVRRRGGGEARPGASGRAPGSLGRSEEFPRRGAGSSGSKETSASSGPSCAAERHHVRPIRSRKSPVRRADSWTCPWRRDRGLAGFEEPADRDAPDVDVEGRVVDATCRRGPRGRGASRTAASGRGRRPAARSASPARTSRSPAIVERRTSRASNGTLWQPFLWRDGARVDEPRHVVALAVLQEEGRGRDAGVAEDGPPVPLVRAAVEPGQESRADRLRRTGRPPRPGRRSRDDEDARSRLAEAVRGAREGAGGASRRRNPARTASSEDVGEQVAPEENGRRAPLGDGSEECLVAPGRGRAGRWRRERSSRALRASGRSLRSAGRSS